MKTQKIKFDKKADIENGTSNSNIQKCYKSICFGNRKKVSDSVEPGKIL